LAAIRTALNTGYRVIERGGSAVDAVEAAVVTLETSGRFNAGPGSKRQMDGLVRMDASIMDGATLAAGAVASVEGILNPVRAARRVMDATPHVLLAGPWAQRFARHFGIPAWVGPRPGRRVPWKTLYRQAVPLQPPGTGTVGAVARDATGRVAAATSTGGIARMLPGRVGDSPLIGAGTYADSDGGAVSMTGHGEVIIRGGLARLIANDLAQGLTPRAAGRRALEWMHRRIGGEAGAIIVSRIGAFAQLHTTRYMACGVRRARFIRVATNGTRVGDR
jgi:beta-aspartyl-peptidase (threonine type)